MSATGVIYRSNVKISAEEFIDCLQRLHLQREDLSMTKDVFKKCSITETFLLQHGRTINWWVFQERLSDFSVLLLSLRLAVDEGISKARNWQNVN
jgi:hypothetical protein